MPLPAPVVEIEWSHSQFTQDGSDDKDWMRGSSLFKFIAYLLVFSPLFSNPTYSFASSTGFWSSNLHFILFQYSGATGDLGSCVEQQRRPSKADATKAPFSWSLQNEWGQNSQNETAGLLQMSHWCHGHSHFPEGGRGGKERERQELQLVCFRDSTGLQALFHVVTVQVNAKKVQKNNNNKTPHWKLLLRLLWW